MQDHYNFDDLGQRWATIVRSRIESGANKKQYIEIKREAWEQLAEDNPKVKTWLDAYQQQLPLRAGVSLTGDAYFGACLMAASGRAISNNGVFDILKPDKPKPEPVIERRNGGVLGLVRSWVENNDTMPSYEVMEHFSQENRGPFYTAKYLLTQEGYLFEKNDCGGWTVTARPEPEPEPEVDERDQRIQELADKTAELLREYNALLESR
jgi:hypothetical protein